MQHTIIYNLALDAIKLRDYTMFHAHYRHLKSHKCTSQTTRLLKEVIHNKDIHLFHMYKHEISVDDIAREAVIVNFRVALNYICSPECIRDNKKLINNHSAIEGKFDLIEGQGNELDSLILGLEHPESIDRYLGETMSKTVRIKLMEICRKCGYSATLRRLETM